jgi:hypothetical protein
VKNLAISLTVLNDMFKSVNSFKDQLKVHQTVFAKETGVVDIEANPFYDSYHLETLANECRAQLTSYIITRYHEAFVPNIDYRLMEEAVDKEMPAPEFNAEKVVSVLNDKFLVNKDKLALNDIIASAQKLFPFGENLKNFINAKRKNVLHGRVRYNSYRSNGTLSDDSIENLYSFGKLVRLLLETSLYQQISPSQVKPIMWVDSSTPVVGKEIKDEINQLIQKLYFFRNGRVDIYFRTGMDCRRVVNVLNGEKPDVYLPEVKIDVQELFTSKKPLRAGRVKRVVKMS